MSDNKPPREFTQFDEEHFENMSAKDCAEIANSKLYKVLEIIQQLEEALELYAHNNTTVLKIVRDTIVVDSNFLMHGSGITTVKTIDKGDKAREALEKLKKWRAR